MSAELAMLAALATPLAQAALVRLFPRPPGLRDLLHIAGSLATAGAALWLLSAASRSEEARLVLAQPLPNVELALAIEPIGAVVGALIACLAVAHAVYAAGLLRAEADRAPHVLEAHAALATAPALMAAYSANLLTFLVAFSALLLAAFPLAAREGDENAQRSARAGLAGALALTFALFLPAMVWTYALAGALEFERGGLLAGRVDAFGANILIVLFVLGIVHAAPTPLRDQLAQRSDAGAQTLALTHCIVVAPIIGAGVIKVTTYVFGAALAEASSAIAVLLAAAGAAMCAAALVALGKQHLQERLAYSLLAQSLLVTAGALLAAPAGTFGAVLQMLAITCAAAAMLMAAGVVTSVTGRRSAKDLTGLGRLMPWTMACFALSAASMIGLPPFSGAWAKLSVIAAAAHQHLGWAGAMAGLAAVLTFAHLGPLAANALAGPAPAQAIQRTDGASLMLLAPVLLCAGATLGVIVFANQLFYFLAPLWASP